MKNLILILLGTALIWGGNAFGLWQATLLIGALYVLFTPTTGRAVLLGLLTGALGWGLPLLLASTDAEIVRLAEVIGGILGLGGTLGTLVALLLPSLVGALLALSTAWIAGAVKSVAVRSRSTEIGGYVPLKQ